MTTGSGRASPPTARVLAVLEFLAAHPGEQFGLSELARRLQVSKPTCLGIVTTLTRTGYLVRDADAKTRSEERRVGRECRQRGSPYRKTEKRGAREGDG